MSERTSGSTAPAIADGSPLTPDPHRQRSITSAPAAGPTSERDCDDR